MNNRDETIQFVTAVFDALDNGDNEFECPLCSRKAIVIKSPYNGHIHAYCINCGIKMMQ